MDDDIKRILQDHLTLGERKPLSYLPIRTIEKVMELSIDEYVQMAQSKNKNMGFEVFRPHETRINSGAVYLYDKVALQKALEENRALVRECNWPEEPAAFVRRVAQEWLDEEDKMLSVIRRIFGDDESAAIPSSSS